MDRQCLTEAVAEAERFLARAHTLLNACPEQLDGETGRYKSRPWEGYGEPVLQGLVRRASLDLSRYLAQLRQWS
jgi:hypothetical protein